MAAVCKDYKSKTSDSRPDQEREADPYKDRKKDDGKEYLVKLENEEEFDEVMISFNKSFNKKEDNNE